MTTLIGFGVLAILMALRIPVGIAMGIVGTAGIAQIVDWSAAYRMIGTIAVRTTTDYAFGIIPMFLLMGSLVSRSGISSELYRAANAFVGHFRGGLALATIGACGGIFRDIWLVCRHGGYFLLDRVSGNVAEILSKEPGGRRDCGRGFIGNSDTALNRACSLRDHHAAGYRQAVQSQAYCPAFWR